MNKRERYLAFAGFEPVDRVPRRASFTPALMESLRTELGNSPYACFDMDTGQGARLRPPDGHVPTDYSSYHQEWLGKDGFTIDANGCGHLSHGFYHFTERISPLRHTDSMDDIENYPLPNYEGWLDDEMRAAAKRAHADGEVAEIFIGHMYENAWQVRGYEAFLMDLLTNRDAAELLLEKYCLNNILQAEAAARCDYDLLMCGDDIASQEAMMFNVDLWREIMKPRWARVWAAARAIKPDILIWYHSDGNLSDVLDDLVEIGVNILNPVQPECMDPLAIRKRFGKRLAFDGCIGTQTTFPFGTPVQMHDVVSSYIEALDGLNGGLMLSPTHVLEPEVPVANIEAFFNACDQVGIRQASSL